MPCSKYGGKAAGVDCYSAWTVLFHEASSSPSGFGGVDGMKPKAVALF